LRLDYTTSDGTDGTISIALDIDDIQQLITSCQSALDKATKSRRLILAYPVYTDTYQC
jgi:hypothetical protein